MTGAPAAVIGLGPMGQAMVRTLLGAGHPVTVWNRTASRAADVVARGATLAATPEEAVSASELVVLSLTDYAAMDEVLGGLGADALAGKVLVNLSSDAPARTREAAAWATERGARFVAGGVMVPAPMVGTDESFVYYSGSRNSFEACAPVLRVLGEPRYLGEDVGLAQLWYQAHLDLFLTTLAALLHAVALVGSVGVPASAFLPDLLATLAGVPEMIGDAAELGRRLDDGEHRGDLSTVTMMGATAHHVTEASCAAGIDLALPLAVRDLYDRTLAAGRGNEDWTSLIDVVRAPAGVSA